MADVSMPSDDTSTDEVVAVDEEVIEDSLEDIVNDPQTLADLDPEDELWEGSPKVKQFVKWREEFPKGVYVTSIDFDEHIVWRPMKRSEYGRISGQMEQMAEELSQTEFSMLNEEMICKTCILFPDMAETDFDDMLAGIPSLISQQILERSGFSSLATREMV